DRRPEQRQDVADDHLHVGEVGAAAEDRDADGLGRGTVDEHDDGVLRLRRADPDRRAGLSEVTVGGGCSASAWQTSCYCPAAWLPTAIARRRPSLRPVADARL